MASELKLQDEFCEILGSNNVYFQPPADHLMSYPCIRYSLSGMDVKRANNAIYKTKKRYKVVVIDPDPDSTIWERVLHRFPMCSFDQAYTSDNLNHVVLTLYH